MTLGMPKAEQTSKLQTDPTMFSCILSEMITFQDEFLISGQELVIISLHRNLGR